MKTSVIEVHDMLPALGVLGVVERIGNTPGVSSVTVNHAQGRATVRYDETRLEIADIKSDVVEGINNTQEGQHHVCDFPQSLRSAQHAIYLPEVQEMLRRLSEYGLGIFMPHMHGEQTNKFRPLPNGVIQVESGLDVTFRPAEEVAYRTDRFLPVGWFWRSGKLAPVAVCEMVRDERQGDTKRYGRRRVS